MITLQKINNFLLRPDRRKRLDERISLVVEDLLLSVCCFYETSPEQGRILPGVVAIHSCAPFLSCEAFLRASFVCHLKVDRGEYSRCESAVVDPLRLPN